MPRKKTTEEFIIAAKNVHGDRYDYSLVEYKGKNSKVKIICSEHGIFEQSPDLHANKKSGCAKCGGTEKSNTESFIKKSIELHGNSYDYSLVEYVNCDTKVKIKCFEHGIFEQTPSKHYLKQGCPVCSNTILVTSKDFIRKSMDVHGNSYDYSLVDYKGAAKKVKIICSKHGEFQQKAQDHYNSKQGCPKCQNSKGEMAIEKYLKDNNIQYETQKKFKGCKYKRELPWDFYLPQFKTMIEFQGIQHFKAREIFGGEKTLEKQQLHDQIKRNFCKSEGYNLIEINYDQLKKVDEIMEQSLSHLLYFDYIHL